MPREVDGDEQQIADLLGHGLGIVLAHRHEHLIEFLAHLVDHRQCVRPVETDLGRALLQLGGATQCRQRARHIVEQGQLLGRGGFLGAFLGLDLFPALLDGRLVEARQIERAVQVAVGKDMRMTPDQLAGDRIDHRGEIETPLFLAQLTVVDDLEQQITQLAGQVLEVAALDGIGHLVRLFQRVRHDAGVILLQVPGAAMLRVAQPGHQVQEVVELVHGIPR